MLLRTRQLQEDFLQAERDRAQLMRSHPASHHRPGDFTTDVATLKPFQFEHRVLLVRAARQHAADARYALEPLVYRSAVENASTRFDRGR
jgi:hypothetical protein